MARGANFTQFKQFAEKYKAVVSKKELNEFLEKFLLEQAEKLIEKTINRTPVDTGTLRAAWQVGETRFYGTEMIVEILNGTEYASIVEYGRSKPSTEQDPRSWMPGRFMLTISLNEIYREMPTRFDTAFKQWAVEKGLGE